jgi:hypothetical protein
MAALSPAQANEASLWFAVFLIALLALSLVAVITSPARAGSPPAQGTDAEPDLLEPGHEPGAPTLPHRTAGQSGWTAPPGMIRPPGLPGGPLWGPAPRPPGPLPARWRDDGRSLPNSGRLDR